MTTSAYTIAYAPERAQYCVERADGLRIWPQTLPFSDPDARKRAETLAAVLNRMEAREPTPDIPPDYCYACDAAVYGVQTPFTLRCPECGAELAEGGAI